LKPAPFSYHRPTSREEVDALLAEHGEDARILAGGQSLVPILNFRLATPGHLVDINHLAEERSEPRSDGHAVSIPPLMRQERAERSAVVTEQLPLLEEAVRFVGHPAIRSRGTVVGSITHADPAAELPAVLATLGGEIVARRAGGQRTISAGDFFTGPLENSLAAEEWVEEVRIPVQRDGGAFEEFAQRSGDYALCGVAAVVERNGGGCAVTLAYLGVGDVARRLELTSLDHDDIEGGVLEEAIHELVATELDPGDDVHASAAYRRHLAVNLAVRAVRRAVGAKR
jgi:CO/xanthine dehydrogenase FAD-binding subunit